MQGAQRMPMGGCCVTWVLREAGTERVKKANGPLTSKFHEGRQEKEVGLGGRPQIVVPA